MDRVKKCYQQLNNQNRMKNFDPKKSEQQQLQEILNETFTNTDYCDEDIGQFLNDPAGNYAEMFTKYDKKQRRDVMLSGVSLKSKGSKTSSRKHSEDANQDRAFVESFDENDDSIHDNMHSNHENGGQFEVFSQQERNSSVQAQEVQIFSDNTQPEQTPCPSQFRKLQNYYKYRISTHSMGQVKQKYPYFIVSQPAYTISKTYTESTFQYNTIKNINIQCMDVGYCALVENYKIAIGSDDGRVALFEKTYTKPVNIFEAFSLKKNKGKNMEEEPKCKVTSIKWSQNLQYLAVSSSRNQFKVYQFKQSIVIQDKNILRTLKQPVEIISLTAKQLRRPVINIKFVSQLPFLVLLNDEDDDMQLLEYKMHFMSYKPKLSKLSIKFNDVYQVDVIDFQVGCHRKTNINIKSPSIFNSEQFGGLVSKRKNNKNGKDPEFGTLLAVSSDQYVTIALLRPYFEVIMVYDKEKHGKNIKKQGYAHISFRKQPLGLLIVWDKFAQLLNIQIESLNPLQPRISNIGSQLMPESTLLAGLITDTLVYQLSESGIKIYSCANFGEEKDSTKYKQSIYEHGINFYELPEGMQIQQQLVQKVPTLTVINLLKSYIKTCNGELFITTNTSLFSVRIQKFEQFIRATIENMNNWKVGLQLLHDAYKGRYKNYDNMTKQVILRNLYEYSIKYVNFLMMVIGNTADPTNTNEQMLWIQETTFLFNILIETEQYEHLFNKILPKLKTSNLSQYIKSLQPFIWLHKLQKVTPAGLQLLYQHINKEIISILLIANIKAEFNEVDLPHTINKILLEHSMFQELVAINLQFNDYFTPLAVLVSHYEAIDSTKFNLTPSNKTDIQLLPQLKMQNKQSSQSEESLKQPVRQNPQKQNLREILIYLIYKILRNINTHEDSSAHYSINQYKKVLTQHKQFMTIFIPLLQTSIIHILLDSPYHEVALFESILPELFSGQCLRIINDISNRQLNTDLMTDIVMGIPISRVHSLRTYWVSIIRLYNRSVIKMEVFMGLRYLVNAQRNQPQIKIKQVPLRNQQSTQKSGEKIKKNLSKTKKQSSIEKFIKQTVRVSGFKIATQFSNLSHSLLEEFYNQLLGSPSNHIGILKIVAIMLGSGFYIKVILAMMTEDSYAAVSNCKPQFTQGESTVYDFIQETIQKFSKNERQALKSIIYQKVQIFIQKDCNKLCDLIIQNYLEDIDKFVRYNTTTNSVNRNGYTGIIIGAPSSRENISSVTVNPYELIHLIEGLLQRLQSADIQKLRIDKFQPHSEWMLDLRLQFLKLLAITGRQHQILGQLQKENYPLDSSLEICRKYGVIDAEAYLLVKSGGEGEIASAIKLYFTLVSQKIKFLSPQTMPNFKQYFLSIIRECIRVCQNLHVAPDHFNQEWFLISEELYELKTNIYRILAAYTGDLLCDIIDKEVYPFLAEKIVRKENPEGIAYYLKLNMGYLDLVFIRALIHEMVKNFAFQKIMFLLIQETYIEVQIQERKKICLQTLKGFKTECSCCLCRQDNGILIHYSNCGHEIHPSCGQDVKQCYICSCRPEKMIEKQLDLRRRIQPELYCRQIQDEIAEQEEKEKKRKSSKIEMLKRYDENAVDIAYT